MPINWDEVLPASAVNLDHVNVDKGTIDKVDAQDAMPDAWKGGVPVQQPGVIYVNPVVAQQPDVNPLGTAQTWLGSNASGAKVQVTQSAPGVKTTLNQASRQWLTRPADERFWTVREMAAKCREYKDASYQNTVDLTKTVVVNDGGRLILTGGGMKGPGEFNHYSFGQLSSAVHFRADHLRMLSDDLAAQNLTYLLQKKGNKDDLTGRGNVLVRREETCNRVGAFTGAGYSRIWNSDIVSRLEGLEADGWRVPPARPAGFDDPRARPATQADLLDSGKGGAGIQVQVGDMIAPAGLYASDRDCFAFMVKDQQIDAGGGLLNRGFFVSNSEVGNKAFEVWTFLYDSVCGNHIVWGASEVTHVRLIHRGKANQRWSDDLRRALVVYANKGTDIERRLIMGAVNTQIADDREAVIEKLYKTKSLGLTRSSLERAYEWSVREAQMRGNIFSPNSVWGMVCGLTRVSQESGWADDRVAIDVAAGKLLKLAA